MPNLMKLRRAAHRVLRAAVKRDSLGEPFSQLSLKINRSYELNYTHICGSNMTFGVRGLLGSDFCGFEINL